MLKKLVGIAALMGIACAGSPAQIAEEKAVLERIVAEDGSSGLDERVVEERPGKSKYRTTAHIFLDLEKELGAVSSDYNILDNLIGGAKQVLNDLKQEKGNKSFSAYNAGEAVDVFEAISGFLKKEGFEDEAKELFNESLKEKKADCDMYAMIYLAVAEEVGLPLTLVNAPEHVFLRWNFDKGDNLGWDPILRRKIDDGFAQVYYKIDDKSVEEGIYLKNLDKGEVLALHYNNLGLIWKRRGDFRKAIGYYEKGLKLDPKSVENWVNLGVAWKNLGDLDQALTCYQKAMQLNPQDDVPQYNSGEIWLERKDYDRAIACYETSIRLNVLDGESHGRLGDIYNLKGDLAKAFRHYTIAAAMAKGDKEKAVFNYQRGLVSEKMGMAETACEYFREAYQLDPEENKLEEHLKRCSGPK